MEKHSGRGIVIETRLKGRHYLRSRRLRTVWIAWAVLTGYAYAEGRQLVIVDADHTEHASKIAQALRQHFTGGNTTVVVRDSPAENEAPSTLHITLGQAPLRALLAMNSAVPILAVLISKTEFLDSMATLSPSRAAKVSAIYMDPNPALQFELIRLLLPKSSRVGVLLGPTAARFAAEIFAAGQNRAMTVTIKHVNVSEDIHSSLNQLTDVSAILAIPDPTIFNKSTLRSILLTTYRRGQPLIGYSPGMVKAGALATVLCDLDHVADQIIRWIDEYARMAPLSPPRYCDHIDVLVNTSVLESLDIVAVPKEELLQRLREAGDQPR